MAYILRVRQMAVAIAKKWVGADDDTTGHGQPRRHDDTTTR
jgi:hypothetical protein